MQPAVEILTVPLAQKEDQAFEELLELAVHVWAQKEAMRGAAPRGRCIESEANIPSSAWGQNSPRMSGWISPWGQIACVSVSG